MLQDEIPVRVLLELFGKRLKERCVVVVQQIPQLSLKGHRRDFTAAIGALPRITFPVRISVGVGIDNLKYQQTGCAFDFVVHFFFLLTPRYHPYLLPRLLFWGSPQDTR